MDAYAIIEKMEEDRLGCLDAVSMLSHKKQSYYIGKGLTTLDKIRRGTYKKYVSDNELELLDVLEAVKLLLIEVAKHLKVDKQSKMTGLSQNKIINYHYLNEAKKMAGHKKRYTKSVKGAENKKMTLRERLKERGVKLTKVKK